MIDTYFRYKMLCKSIIFLFNCICFTVKAVLNPGIWSAKGILQLPEYRIEIRRGENWVPVVEIIPLNLNNRNTNLLSLDNWMLRGCLYTGPRAPSPHFITEVKYSYLIQSFIWLRFPKTYFLRLYEYTK